MVLICMQDGFILGGQSGDANLLLCEFLGILFIIAWCVAIMYPFFFTLNMLGMFRVDPLDEEVGLDISHHKGSAYDLDGPSKTDVEELVTRNSEACANGIPDVSEG